MAQGLVPFRQKLATYPYPAVPTPTSVSPPAMTLASAPTNGTTPAQSNTSHLYEYGKKTADVKESAEKAPATSDPLAPRATNNTSEKYYFQSQPKSTTAASLSLSVVPSSKPASTSTTTTAESVASSGKLPAVTSAAKIWGIPGFAVSSAVATATTPTVPASPVLEKADILSPITESSSMIKRLASAASMTASKWDEHTGATGVGSPNGSGPQSLPPDSKPPAQLQTYLQERAVMRVKQQEYNLASPTLTQKPLPGQTSSTGVEKKVMEPQTKQAEATVTSLGSFQLRSIAATTAAAAPVQSHIKLPDKVIELLPKDPTRHGNSLSPSGALSTNVSVAAATRAATPTTATSVSSEQSFSITKSVVTSKPTPISEQAGASVTVSLGSHSVHVPQQPPPQQQQQSVSDFANTMDDYNYAPRNVTMNVKDLPSKITSNSGPLPNSGFPSHHMMMAKNQTMNTITQMKANANLLHQQGHQQQQQQQQQKQISGNNSRSLSPKQKMASKTGKKSGKKSPPSAAAGSSSSVAGGNSSSGDPKPGPSGLQWQQKQGRSDTSHQSNGNNTDDEQGNGAGKSGEPVPSTSNGIGGGEKSVLFLKSNQDQFTKTKEGKFLCGVCSTIFSKASQLRLHLNIHYMERKYKCEDCKTSFRTKGHLVKHERSNAHLNKVRVNQAFGAPSEENPRPFKCVDCTKQFRIHGHMAKHLRSKTHIMNLECSGKLPMGMFAELERLGTNLHQIDTTDPEKAIKSLQEMAEDMYKNDPTKLPHLREAASAAERSSQSSASEAEDDRKQVPLQLQKKPAPQPQQQPQSLPQQQVKIEPSETVGPVQVPGTVPMGRDQLEKQQHQPFPSNGDHSEPSAGPSKSSSSSSSDLKPNFQQSLRPQQHQQPQQQQPKIQPSFFREPNPGMRRGSFSSSQEERSTDSDSEMSLGLPNGSAQCKQCLQVFPDVKSRQVHIFVEHQSPTGACSSSSSSPAPASPSAPPPGVISNAHLATGSNTPTLHNGELLAAARMVNLHQNHPGSSSGSSSDLGSSASQLGTATAAAAVVGGTPPHNGGSSSVVSASVTSSSNRPKDLVVPPSFHCDYCGLNISSMEAFTKVRI